MGLEGDGMVKLTVFYNLPDGADHDEFLKWRIGPHQKGNAGMPGVIKTDFYAAKATPLGEPAYRYITEAYFATMDDLNASFFTPEAQAKLQEDIKRIKDPVFLISEEVITTENRG